MVQVLVKDPVLIKKMVHVLDKDPVINVQKRIILVHENGHVCETMYVRKNV